MKELRHDVSILKDDVSDIKHDVRQNTEDLTEHKAGVITARQIIKQNQELHSSKHKLIEAEIEKLKKPKELRKMLFDFMLDTAKLAGSITAVYGLYKLFF